MNRRGFLGTILAAGAAPAIVRADSLMRVVPRDTLVHYRISNLAVSTEFIGADGALWNNQPLSPFWLGDQWRAEDYALLDAGAAPLVVNQVARIPRGLLGDPSLIEAQRQLNLRMSRLLHAMRVQTR